MCSWSIAARRRNRHPQDSWVFCRTVLCVVAGRMPSPSYILRTVTAASECFAGGHSLGSMCRGRVSPLVSARGHET